MLAQPRAYSIDSECCQTWIPSSFDITKHVSQDLKPCAISKCDISNMSHTNFFDILRWLERVFCYNLAKYYKYYLIIGCHTWIICQITVTYFQNECQHCCLVIGGMPVTMSQTNNGSSENMVQNHFWMFSFKKNFLKKN